MPRYNYRCTHCNLEQTIQHLSSETISTCEKCRTPDSMKKLLSRFTTSPKATISHKVGAITEDFITDAREDLKKQKREMKEGS